jgi:hypothetical protein
MTGNPVIKTHRSEISYVFLLYFHIEHCAFGIKVSTHLTELFAFTGSKFGRWVYNPHIHEPIAYPKLCHYRPH